MEPTLTFIIQSTRKWIIRRDPVYRLLDQNEYLDNFFKKGEIFLSCFELFKKYPNEIQGDKTEGQALLSATTTEGRTIMTMLDSASKAFIMSTTRMLTKKVISDFKAKGAIRIINPPEFAAEISKRIPFFLSGTEGRCKYQEHKIMHRRLTEQQSKKYSIPKNNPLSEQDDLVNKVSHDDEMFLKLNKYSDQDEYRLIWFTDKIQKEHVIVQCPEALKYCERIDF